MNPITRVALLDNHTAVRAGVEAILAPQRDLQLVGVAADEHELWPLLGHTQPTVLLLGLHHPGRDGLALCMQIKHQHQPDPPALVLDSSDTPTALIVAAAVAGADAILSKSSTTATLLEAIRAVARNPRTTPPVTPRMKADAAARLDPADHAILAMRVAGDSPTEIAATLGIPNDTITRRIAAIITKLEPLTSAA
jgi:DNA-binding NarL/FixJ family response regulator